MISPDRRGFCEAAVIGAGPYGLAVAAHLKTAGIATRVFGEPMAFWRNNMPKGMKLRSPWHATHIADPGGDLSLDVYARDSGLPRVPQLPLEDFIRYGHWFQSRIGHDLDGRKVRSIAAADPGFRLRLDDDDTVSAHRVIVATGLAHQHLIPEEFQGLPKERVSHTCEHPDLGVFRGRRVAVVGRGQSAAESAALLAEAGADVELIARGPINWLGAASAASRTRGGPTERLRELMTAPSAVGPFPLNWLVELPGAVHRLPAAARARLNTRSLRAGAAGWLKPRFEAIPVKPQTIHGVAALRNGIVLRLEDGHSRYDRVLLATGYRIDIEKLGLLDDDLLRRVKRLNGAPILRGGLESSVPGLHFVGSPAVASFGPLMRFIAGSGYAARAVTKVAVLDRARLAAAATHPAPSALLSGAAPGSRRSETGVGGVA
jgi:cation diffusion facilitator CzcD-associated flavoprotein CzcO